MAPKLRRRDFLRGSVALVAGYGLVKGGVRGWAWSSAPPPATPLQHLPPRLAATVRMAALNLIGPAGEIAFATGRWDPVADVDRLLGVLAPDQVQLLCVGMGLLEEWTWGLRGFSEQGRKAQRARLEAWRESDLALHRSVWGFLHAGTALSFSTCQAGWDRMGYPGPCVGEGGRKPGQSVRFDWDPVVP